MSGHVEVFVSRKSCKTSSKAFQANSVPLALCLATCQSTIYLSLIGSLVSLSPETDLSSLFAHSCLKSLNAIYFLCSLVATTTNPVYTQLYSVFVL